MTLRLAHTAIIAKSVCPRCRMYSLPVVDTSARRLKEYRSD